MINTPIKILLTFTFIIGMLLSCSIFYTGVNVSYSTEITAENNCPSENLISTSDLTADDQINTCYKIPYLDINLIKNKIFTSFFILSQPSFSVWQPPKLY